MSLDLINVLLVSPGYFSREQFSFGNNHLVALGTALQEWTGARVRILDLDYEALLPQPANDILFDSKFDLIGISCYSSFDYLKSFYLGVEIRRRNSSVCLVVGGYHASARPSDFLGEDSPFDYVVVGEGELPLTRIVKALQKGEQLEERTLGPEPVEDLDQLPLTDWHLLDRYLPVSSRLTNEVTLYLSRGCVFDCSFCMEAAKGSRTWRAFSLPRAEEEIRRFHQWINLKDRRLFLSDPLFGLNRDWRLEMLERIERMVLPTSAIWALSRADILEDEDFDYFKRAKFGLGFGLESGDVDMLKVIHKGGPGEAKDYLERFIRLARITAAVGVPWGANIIVGHPGETAESMVRSAQWIHELFRCTEPLTGFLSVDPYRFYPGSPIDVNSSYYEEHYGTCFYRPRWWNYSEPEFTSMWIDPSRSLDFRTRERMMAELFLPILEYIARKFSYKGYAEEQFRIPTKHQLRYLQPLVRIRTISNFYLWQQLTGRKNGDVRLDPEVVELLKQERTRTLQDVIKHFGPISQSLQHALIEVPRERFVEEKYLWKSAGDRTLPLLPENTSTLSAIHAYAVNYRLLDLSEGDCFLELGGGTGYGAAVAAQLVTERGKVRTVEIEPQLAELAVTNLKEFKNVEVTPGKVDLKQIVKEGYNKILFCYVLDELPDILDLLPVNSRLAAPVRSSEGKQILTLVEKTQTGTHISQHGPVLYVADKSE
jgi:protein-L-isoaspartate(D-aspartate) O-methyltransferase